MVDIEIVPYLRIFNDWIQANRSIVEKTATLAGVEGPEFIKIMLDDAIDAWTNSVLCGTVTQ